MSARGAVRALACGAAVLAAAGAVRAAETVRTSDADVQEQLFKLQKDNALLIEKVTALAQLLGGQAPQQNACAEAAARAENLEKKMRVMEEQFLATQKRLDDIVTELRAQRRGTAVVAATAAGVAAGDAAAGSAATPVAAPAAAPVVAPVAAPRTAAPSSSGGQPEDLFNGAYADYSRGNYDLALAGFEAALRADREGPLADDAQLWIGESLYAKGRFADAASAFDAVITGWPKSDKLPIAHLKKGFALYEARRTAEGVSELQRVMQTWPSSDEARLAREFLKKHGAL